MSRTGIACPVGSASRAPPPYFCCIGWPQHESAPSPAFVTIISELHFVHWYRLPTWFATHPSAYCSDDAGRATRTRPVDKSLDSSVPARQANGGNVGVGFPCYPTKDLDSHNPARQSRLRVPRGASLPPIRWLLVRSITSLRRQRPGH